MSSDYSSRARLYRDALYDALIEGGSQASDGEPLAVLGLIVERCRGAAGEDPTAAGALDAFEAILRRQALDDAVSEAASLFESPQRFREALFFLRCLDRDAAGALTLMRQRAYLSGAVAPAASYPELATDQAALLDASTFETLWREPGRLDWMDDTIQIWRRAYLPVYIAQHGGYHRHLAGIVGDIEAALWQVDALEKLNRLDRLGEPVALPALTRFHVLAELPACSMDAVQLTAELSETPVCPYCAFRLGEMPPVEELNATLIAIERGLATQQGRLARRVVSRLVARPGRAQEDRLNRFINVVQASDLSGLAQVLDEGLLEFLGDLLLTPEPRVNLIDRLAQDYPEVTDDRLDEVVAAFRALVLDELQRGGGRVVIGREDDLPGPQVVREPQDERDNE
jgi:hypothetical protein